LSFPTRPGILALAMPRTIVKTPHAPAAIGPYSQAVQVTGGRTLYLSGQIALDPATGEIVGAGDVKAQTERVLDNLAAILRAADMDFGNIVKAGIFLTDLQDFGTVNTCYGARFTADPPARATVQVSALPKGVLVEIDAIAVADA
jgi:2-iminobutanoate/2-iminopropanoate deaminase